MLLVVIFGTLFLIGVILLLIYLFELVDDPLITYNLEGKHEAQGRFIENYEDLGLSPYTYYPCDMKHRKRLSYRGEYNNIEGLTIGGSVIIVAFTFALLICGVMCLCNTNSIVQANQLTTYEVCIEQLQDRKQTIQNYLKGDFNVTYTLQDGSYHVIVDQPLEIKKTIDEYNNDVRNLKKSIYMQKIQLESPWINWYTNPSFQNIESYNPNTTNYKDILGDILPTFEIEQN